MSVSLSSSAKKSELEFQPLDLHEIQDVHGGCGPRVLVDGGNRTCNSIEAVSRTDSGGIRIDAFHAKITHRKSQMVDGNVYNIQNLDDKFAVWQIPEGFYNYVLLHDGQLLRLVRVTCTLEIGSRHSTMVDEYDLVYAAGELYKSSEGKIVFNFFIIK